MRIPFLLLFLTILTTSCELPPVDNSPYLPNKQSLANDVRARTAFQLKMKEGLIPFGTAGQLTDEIKMLGLSFQYHKEISIEEARDLLLKSATLLIQEINNNELIRPHLNNYPFEIKNIEILIFLFKDNGRLFECDKLQVVTMVEGKLQYISRSSDTNLLKTIYTETYEEAIEKLGLAENF